MTISDIKPLTKEWHDHRRARVTGTDIAAILGVSPHKTALQVWARITGKHREDFQGNAFTEWGNATEAANRELLAERAGLEVTDSPGLLQDPEFPWLVCTPDGLVGRKDDPDAPHGIWEGKSPSVWTAKDWTDDEAPIAYQVQIQGQLRISGLRWGVLSALIPPRKADDSPLWWREVEHNQRFQEAMMEQLLRFWDENVQRDIPPVATAHDIDARVLKALHPKDNGTAIVLSGVDYRVMAQELERAKELEKRASKQRAELEAVLKQAIGDASYAVIEDGPVFSWKHQVQQVEAKPAHAREFRVLRQLKSLPRGVEVAS